MPQAHYPRAPIIEAIIELQVRFKEVPSEEQFQACYERVKDTLPTKESMEVLEVGVARLNKPGGAVSLRSGSSRVGLRLRSSSRDRVLQIQQRGFTYSHLPRYTEWETFCAEARPLWSAFIDTCKPETITRVAVRYINRIVIPEVPIELYDYFNLYPNLPKGVPQDVVGLFLQLHMPQPDLAPDALAVINLALDEPPAPNSVSILLDFDVFRQAEYPPETEEVWGFLDRLRDRKNELFEACITEKTRELIR